MITLSLGPAQYTDYILSEPYCLSVRYLATVAVVRRILFMVIYVYFLRGGLSIIIKVHQSSSKLSFSKKSLSPSWIYLDGTSYRTCLSGHQRAAPSIGGLEVVDPNITGLVAKPLFLGCSVTGADDLFIGGTTQNLSKSYKMDHERLTILR